MIFGVFVFSKTRLKVARKNGENRFLDEVTPVAKHKCKQ